MKAPLLTQLSAAQLEDLAQRTDIAAQEIHAELTKVGPKSTYLRCVIDCYYARRDCIDAIPKNDPDYDTRWYRCNYVYFICLIDCRLAHK